MEILSVIWSFIRTCFGKMTLLGASLIVSVVFQVFSYFIGWTNDGGTLWAVSNGFYMWLAFTLIIGAAKRLGLQWGWIFFLCVVMGGGILWLILQVSSTPFNVIWWKLWLIAVPHWGMGFINAKDA